MTTQDQTSQTSVAFGARFAESSLFKQVYAEGMGLVEETAAYLDGKGRIDSRRLDKVTALTYATESMRLTTRLMQVASWLLIRRAVAEGEMPATEAAVGDHRIPLKPPGGALDRANFDDLPEGLRRLIVHADHVYGRIYRLDKMLCPTAETDEMPANAVGDQIDRLRAVFGAEEAGRR